MNSMSVRKANAPHMSARMQASRGTGGTEGARCDAFASRIDVAALGDQFY
jgi:hypothetical protein